VLNATKPGAQQQPAAAALANGDVLVVWVDGGQRHTPSRIKARLFTSQGVPKAGEIRISGPESPYALDPALAVGPQGDFLVAWQGRSTPAVKSSQIYARRFAAGGQPLGAAFLVSRCRDCWQEDPAAGRAADGRFVVAWDESDGGTTIYDTHTTDAYFRRFAADGRPLAPKQRVTPDSYGSQYDARVAVRPDGSFVLVYTDIDEDPDSEELSDVYAFLVSANGTRGETFLVNQKETFYFQGTPALALNSDGRFAVLWVDDFNGAIYGQAFTAVGEPQGETFEIVSILPYGFSYVFDLSLAWLPSGHLIAVWDNRDDDDRASGFDIFLRQLRPEDPLPATPPPAARVNLFTPGRQSAPVLAIGPDGQGLLVWQSMLQDGDDFGIVARQVRVP
jgi:hypothetical protein